MQQKSTYFYVLCWPISRVLSFKIIINLDMTLLSCSSGHGNGRVAHKFHTLHLTEFTACYCHQYHEWALTSLFHHCQLVAVSFCCTFPQVTLAWRYQAWLLYDAQTFLTKKARLSSQHWYYSISKILSQYIILIILILAYSCNI